MATSFFRERAGLRARNPFRKSIPGIDDVPEPIFVQPPGDAQQTPEPSPAPARATAPVTPPYVDPVELARGEYEADVPTGAKGLILHVLKTAGLGALKAAAENPQDPLGAAIGGAAAGGIISGVSPKHGRRFQFEMIERPRIEAQERRRLEMLKRQQAQEDRALKHQEKQADIDLKRSTADRNRRPERAENPYRDFPGGIYDSRTGQIVQPAPAKDRPPAYRQGSDGNYYNIEDPAEEEALRKLNARLPRDKFGRFISRSDERATARGLYGDGGIKDTKVMRKATADFDRTKAALEDASRRGDDAMVGDLRKRLQNMAANLASRYGDKIEVGGGEWPYWKPRNERSVAPQQQPQQNATIDQLRAYANENGITIEEARKDFAKAGVTIR
ncbi:MAG: hypothetical protein ACREA2_08320 [Blastocatellia bacterium]